VIVEGYRLLHSHRSEPTGGITLPAWPPAPPAARANAPAVAAVAPRAFEPAVGAMTADVPRARRASDPVGALSVAPGSLALPKNLTAAARPPLRQPMPPPSTIWMRVRRVLFGLKPMLEE